MSEQKIWVEKYRPIKVEDVVLPPRLTKVFRGYAKQGFIPNVTLAGPHGVGKTSVILALIAQLGGEVLLVNGSLDGNIDTLRGLITQFCSTMSLSGERKYVVVDEGDGLNIQSTQPALRGFIEEHSRDCSFIITCNFPNKIMPEIRSRCPVIDFAIHKDERVPLMKKYMAALVEILDAEEVKYNPGVIAQLIGTKFPDFREIIGIVQSYSMDNAEIDVGVLTTASKEQISELLTAVQNKDFKAIRTWVGENSDLPYHDVYRIFYDQSYKLFKEVSIPAVVGILAKGLDWHSRSVDQEITMTVILDEISKVAQWAS